MRNVEGVELGASPSSRRAWIEMLGRCGRRTHAAVALLAEGVDRNYKRKSGQDLMQTVALLAEGVDRNHRRTWSTSTPTSSPSSRRAWIEMRLSTSLSSAVRSPSSRRAWIEIPRAARPVPPRFVALLAEGVDRNIATIVGKESLTQSPSSRRAWIEIILIGGHVDNSLVALLAEGVDRNVLYCPVDPVLRRRPPRGGRG